MNKDNFIIKSLGIDASLTGTGLCIVTCDFLKGSMPVTTTLTNDLKGIERIIFIEEEVRKWANEVDIVVIEDYAYDQPFRREVLGELQGVLKRRLYIMNKEVLIVNTQKVKEILTGEAKKPSEIKKDIKKWTMDETLNKYGIDFKGKDNECDAFGLAIIGLFYKLYQDNPCNLDNYLLQKRVIEKIFKKNPPKPKRTLKFFDNLPFSISVTKNTENSYTAYIPALDYYCDGISAKEAYKNAVRGKKQRIRELRKKKKDKNNTDKKFNIKTSAKYMRKTSYVIYKNK